MKPSDVTPSHGRLLGIEQARELLEEHGLKDNNRIWARLRKEGCQLTKIGHRQYAREKDIRKFIRNLKISLAKRDQAPGGVTDFWQNLMDTARESQLKRLSEKFEERGLGGIEEAESVLNSLGL